MIKCRYLSLLISNTGLNQLSKQSLIFAVNNLGQCISYLNLFLQDSNITFTSQCAGQRGKKNHIQVLFKITVYLPLLEHLWL